MSLENYPKNLCQFFTSLTHNVLNNPVEYAVPAALFSLGLYFNPKATLGIVVISGATLFWVSKGIRNMVPEISFHPHVYKRY
jgi:hypothetical protein